MVVMVVVVTLCTALYSLHSYTSAKTIVRHRTIIHNYIYKTIIELLSIAIYRTIYTTIIQKYIHNYI